MPRWLLKRILPLFVLGLGLTFSPARVHAQDEEDGQQMDEQTRAEVEKLVKRLQTADEELQQKDYDNALKHYEKFFEKLEASKLEKKWKDQLEQNARYNYACGLSLSGKKDDAIKAFARAVELGFWDWKHIDEDTDLDNIRKEDGFKKAIEAGKALEKKQSGDAIKKALAAPPQFDFDFNVKTIDGKDLKLADLKGKVVIVDFWGTWCPPCVVETPQLENVYQAYKSKGVTFVGVDIKEGSRDAPKSFVKDNHIEYPMIYDENGETALRMGNIRVQATPFTVLLDKQHRVAGVFVGPLTPKDLEPMLNRLTAGD